MFNHDDKTAAGGRAILSGAVLFPLVVLGISLFLHVVLRAEVGRPVTLFGAAPQGLQPHVMPRVVLAGVSAAAFWTLLVELRRGQDPVDLPNLRVVLTSLASFAFAACLVPLGFVPASVLTVVILALYLGARDPVGIGIAAVAVPLVLYLVFTRVLFVALPPSFLGF